MAAEVTYHDYYALMINVYRAVVMRNFIPAGEGAAARLHREYRRVQYDIKFRDLCAVWRAKLENDISDRQEALRTGVTKPSMADDMHDDTIALRKTEIVALDKFIDECRSQKQPIAKSVLRPKALYYKEFSSLMVSHFWQGIWSREIAFNTYHWASSAIAIEKCSTLRVIGEIMSNTFQVCADMTWQHVLAPRLENIEIRYESISFSETLRDH